MSDQNHKALHAHAKQRLAAAPDEAIDLPLAQQLQKASAFGSARQLLARLVPPAGQPIAASQQPLLQRWALCTYKDEHLPFQQRLQDALTILERIGLRDPMCNDPETLGQAGAIYKRLWQSRGLIEYLHTALHYYQAGWQRNALADFGYCGVNAALICDLLALRSARLARQLGGAEEQAQQWRDKAKALRKDMRLRLPVLADAQPERQHDYWYLVTQAEIAWGLQDWPRVAEWLLKAKACQPADWMMQSTVQQLGLLSHALELEALPEMKAALALLVPEGTVDAALEAHRGKLGLGLSGGGFRAALYHLGVLARLAECDMLRSVEVISTVSGGSIVGAHYYLALRQRMQSGRPMQRDDYIQLVQQLISQFVAGVQHNLRIRTFSSLQANLQMLAGTYNRSLRMGELYQRYLFSSTQAVPADGLTPFHELKIKPEPDFHPQRDNWRCRCKVPTLLVNTTSLNSGHNWRFTSSWLGEPTGLGDDAIDMNQRYRRYRYHELAEATQVNPQLHNFPFCHAIAASSGVPGLFPPMPVAGLYPQSTVQLVDGGVHDNQGVAGLLDEGCNLLIISDASGQMDDQPNPGQGMIATLLRSNSILQDRVREAQYEDLSNRLHNHALQGLCFIHLKQGLHTPPLNRLGEYDSQPASDSVTDYGISRQLQSRIAALRTDLDSFSEVECYSLMASGYLTVKQQLSALQQAAQGPHWCGFDVHPEASGLPLGDWPFQPLFPLLAETAEQASPARQELLRQLTVGQEMFGKPFLISTKLRRLGYVLLAVLLLLAVALVASYWQQPLAFTIGHLLLALALSLALSIFPTLRLLRPKQAAESKGMKWLVASAGWLGSKVWLSWIDPVFLRAGRLDRLLKIPKAQ